MMPFILGAILGHKTQDVDQGGFDLEIMGPRLDREGRLPAIGRSAERVGNILRELGA